MRRTVMTTRLATTIAMPTICRATSVAPSSSTDQHTASAGWAACMMLMLATGTVRWANTIRAWAAVPVSTISPRMYGTECHVTLSRSPVAVAIGRIVNVAIGITEAITVTTSMPTRIIRLDTRYRHQNDIETNAMALPNQLASPLAGALNSTRASPTS